MDEKKKLKSPILEIWRRLKEGRKQRSCKGQEKNTEDHKEKHDSGT